jgi:tRNA(fMet)-specific endonuclease VapC
MYLLDTNICIAIIRRKPQQVLQRLTQQVLGTVGISSITVAELHYGVAKSTQPSQNMAALEQFLLPLDLLDFDMAAAAAYGAIRADLERRGLPIGAMDLLIAAHGLSANRIVVTHNTSEFARVPGMQIEDWLADSKP